MKIVMYCPACGCMHGVELLSETANTTIKGRSVEYVRKYYRCDNVSDDNEFVDGRILNENLAAAREAYGVLTGGVYN